MKKYFRYIITSLKMNTAYKADYFLSLIMDTIFFFMSFALWKIIYSEGNLSQINTYSLRDTVTYFLITSVLFRVEVSNSIYLNWQIWNGYFTNDLLKPWSLTAVYVLDVIGEKFFIIALYLPVLAAMYFSAKDYILLPTLPYFLCFLVSVIFSFFLGIAFNLIFHSLCFKYGDQDSNIEFFNYIALFFAGAFFPISFLPHKIYTIFNILPFKNLFFVPIQVFLGKMSMIEIYQSWLQSFLWIFGFYLVYKLVFKKGLKYYTGTGR